MSTPDKKILISYASENKIDGIVLCHLLEKRGIPCWIAPRDIRPGDNYGKAIIEAIDIVNTVVVMLTECSNQSEYVAREVERSASTRKRLIPLIFGDVSPSGQLALFLSNIQWVRINEAKWKTMVAAVSKNEDLLDFSGLVESPEIARILDEIALSIEGGEPSGPTTNMVDQPRETEPGVINKKMTVATVMAVATVAFLIFFGTNRNRSDDSANSPSEPSHINQAAVVPFSGADLSRALEHVLELSKTGNTQKAQELITDISAQYADDRLVRAVASYLDTNRKQTSRDNLNKLAEMLEERKSTLDSRKTEGSVPIARPRVLACIGPVSKQDGDGDTTATLYRICIQSELEAGEGVQVVEREAIETVFEEMNLGSSNLADAGSRLELGKLLPAGILLLGDIITGSGNNLIYLRLVDTETTRVISTIKGSAAQDDDIGSICSGLAAQVRAKILEEYPLETVGKTDGPKTITVPIGRFHGAGPSTEFNVYADLTANALLGQARMKQLGDAESTLEMKSSLPAGTSEVYLVEKALN